MRVACPRGGETLNVGKVPWSVDVIAGQPIPWGTVGLAVTADRRLRHSFELRVI